MTIAKDVVDQFGRVLVTAGMRLKPEMLGLLSKHEVVSVWVQDDKTNQEIITVQNLVSAATRLKLMYSVQNAFYGSEGLNAHLKELRVSVDEIVRELSGREYVLIYLNDIRFKSEYLFMHSVNVGLFAIAIGMSMGLSQEDLSLLGMGGFLHDYGKTRIPKVILDKQGSLTWEEFSKVKEHSTFGYNILKIEEKIDYRITLMALQHHEWCDGRGYPWGITGQEIHPLAKIVAVADVYDALTTDRVYRSRIVPNQAIQMINQGCGMQFDVQVIEAFNKIVVPYEIGTTVKLDNNICGAVVRINSAAPARPVLWTEHGRLNLLHQPDRSIVTVI